MRYSVIATLALAIFAAPLFSPGAVGAAESGPDWPAAADLVSPNVAVDLSGDGVNDIWVLEIDTARDTEGDVGDLARRCRAAGLTTEQCRRILRDHHAKLAERCRNAGLTVAQCRRILNNDDPHTIAERCRAAGLTTEECREIIDDQHGQTLAERCRAAGLTPEECREIINDHNNDRPTIAERCRAAGLTPEECREILNDADDGDDRDRPRDRVTDRVRDRVVDVPTRR
jgi:DNA-binding transcriptional MerR regulator